jgi:hypothetical protein
MFYDLRGGYQWPQKFPGSIRIRPDPYGKQLASWIRNPDPKEIFTDPQHCSSAYEYLQTIRELFDTVPYLSAWNWYHTYLQLICTVPVPHFGYRFGSVGA